MAPNLPRPQRYWGAHYITPDYFQVRLCRTFFSARTTHQEAIGRAIPTLNQSNLSIHGGQRPTTQPSGKYLFLPGIKSGILPERGFSSNKSASPLCKIYPILGHRHWGNNNKNYRHQKSHLDWLLLPPPPRQILQGRYQNRPAPLQAQRRCIIHWSATLQRRNGIQRRAISGWLHQPPVQNPEERCQGRINLTRLHWSPPRVSSGGHASPSGISSTTWHHWQGNSLKLQERQKVATDQRGGHHGHYQIRHLSGRPSNWVHQDRHQRSLPTSRRCNCSPHGAGGSIHHLPCGEVSERHNDPLLPHNREEFHRSPLREDVWTWRPHGHYDISRQPLVPIGTQGPSRPLLQGVSVGLLQDQCVISNTNIDFLAHS